MSDSAATKPPDKPRAYVPEVGPGLKKLLAVVFALFAILAINSGYLAAVTFAEWYFSEVLQNYFYQSMFLVHLVLGLLITVPVIVFGVIHSKNTYKRRNRRAVRAGFALFAASLLLLASGIVLTRVEGILEIKDGNTRDIGTFVGLRSLMVDHDGSRLLTVADEPAPAATGQVLRRARASAMPGLP